MLCTWARCTSPVIPSSTSSGSAVEREAGISHGSQSIPSTSNLLSISFLVHNHFGGNIFSVSLPHSHRILRPTASLRTRKKMPKTFFHTFDFGFVFIWSACAVCAAICGHAVLNCLTRVPTDRHRGSNKIYKRVDTKIAIRWTVSPDLI